MGSARRREREKENLKRAILDAARELFVLEDYKAISMRRIAEKIDYSPTAIYLHFKDKEEIFLHLVSEGFDLLTSKMQLSRDPDPVRRFRGLGRAYLEFALENPHYYKIMFEMELPFLNADCEPEKKLGDDCFGIMERCILEGRDAGVFHLKESPNATACAIWAMVHGAASLSLSNHVDHKLIESREEFYSAVLELTLRGLQAA